MPVDASFLDECFKFRADPVLDPFMNFGPAVAEVDPGPGSPASDGCFAGSIATTDDQNTASVVLVRIPKFVADMGVGFPGNAKGPYTSHSTGREHEMSCRHRLAGAGANANIENEPVAIDSSGFDMVVCPDLEVQGVHDLPQVGKVFLSGRLLLGDGRAGYSRDFNPFGGGEEPRCRWKQAIDGGADRAAIEDEALRARPAQVGSDFKPDGPSPDNDRVMPFHVSQDRMNGRPVVWTMDDELCGECKIACPWTLYMRRSP